jgi:glucose-6-phosphate isomerase
MWNNNPVKQNAWDKLRQHQADMSGVHMRDLFASDPGRFDRFHIGLDGLLLDYSRHIITDETMSLLCGLAESSDFSNKRGKLFSGAAINSSENRAVLHTALRGSGPAELFVDGEDVHGFVRSTLSQMKTLSNKIRDEGIYTDIVNLGIGGSDLGPRLACHALQDFALPGLNVHFVANVDPATLDGVLKTCRPDTTLFVVASKTFGTQETMMNAAAAKEWLGARAIHKHFIAVTSHPEAARAFGISDDHILPMRSWIGGRFSLWSAVGFSVALLIGFENFQKLLSGAKAMDTHFQTAPLHRNMPVIMAMLGIWHRNFWDFRAQAILPYAEALALFPDYLQQIDMESNGKSVAADGRAIDIATGAISFGQIGTNAQHAFMQFFHQGRDIVPCDFVMIAPAGPEPRRLALLANALGQAEALMHGKQDESGPAHSRFAGNRPSSSLVLDRLDPYHLGMLLALYEHKIFTQGCIWEINSFDQWGVELGKTLTQSTLKALETGTVPQDCDASTRGLLGYLLARR